MTRGAIFPLPTICAVVETTPKIAVDLLVLFRESGISTKKNKGHNCFIGLDTVTNLCTQLEV